MKILVVCMGNICRSPTAEAVLRAKVAQRGLDIDVDSAGTIAYHEGELPDSRSRKAGENRGYSFKGITARKVMESDFEAFDLILAADDNNLADLMQRCPPSHQHKVKLMLDYAPHLGTEIPDPYYGGANGFETVIDLIEEVSEAILDDVASR